MTRVNVALSGSGIRQLGPRMSSMGTGAVVVVLDDVEFGIVVVVAWFGSVVVLVLCSARTVVEW